MHIIALRESFVREQKQALPHVFLAIGSQEWQSWGYS
jgi:hypothetical protein